jgi:hypothetical protein
MTLNAVRFANFSRCAAMFLLFPGGAQALMGQASSGAFRGHVVDPSGSPVAAAKVAARNQATAVVAETVTDASGAYLLSHLVPGTYTVSASKAGFKELSSTDLDLNLDQQIDLDLSLTLGSVTDSVTVTSATPVLQTHSVDTGQVIESREITDLPLNGRNFEDLFFLTAGVDHGVGGNSSNLSVSGQREFSNSVVLNGIEVTSNRNNDPGVTPSVDAMQEFKVVTSAYSAEFGRASGGVILLQTKSGANEVHGDAYLFYRPKETAAQEYFSTTGSDLHHDNFGGTVGGPIIHDKTFFFVSYEGGRVGSSESFISSTPPTNLISFLPNGDADLTKLVDPYDGTQIPIFDPLFYAQNYYSQQFCTAENGSATCTPNIIPANRISAAGKAILEDFFPKPLFAGTDNGWYNNSIYDSNYKYYGNNVDARIDHSISANDKLSGEYHLNRFNSLQTDPYGGQIPVNGGGGTDTGDNTHSQDQNLSIAETHIFSPKVINDFRFGFINFSLSQLSLLNGQDTANTYGVGNVNLPGYPATAGFPYIYLGSGYTTGGSSYKPLTFLDRNYQLIDTVSVSRDHHQFKFGGEYRKLSSHPYFSLFPTGYQYYATYGSSLTSDPTYSYYDPSALSPNGGSDLADLLLGLPYTVNIGLQLTNPVTLSWELHGFFQDEWHVTPHLALFYGVRYEYQNPYYEKNNNYSNYDPATDSILLAGRGGNSRALINADKNNFAPRVGFAYQFGKRTVLRGGYGVYYSPENDAREDVLTKNYPFNNQQLYFNNIYNYYSTGFPSYTLDTGVPRDTTINIPSGASSIDPSTIANSASQSVYYVDPNLRTGYSQLFNITLQREVAPNMSLDIAYVGAQARKLPYAVGNINLNDAVSPYLGQIDAQYSEGNSSYNSLQVKLTKKYSNYLSFLVAYTYAKSLDNGPAPFDLGVNHEAPQNPDDLAAEYAASTNDIKHNIVGSFDYGLPFGKSHMFLSGAKGWQQYVLGGWQLNGIMTIHTGLPYNIIQQGNNQNYPGYRPDLVGDPFLQNPTVGPYGQYFNPKAFALPACVAPLKVCPGDLGRNAYFGPGFFDFDASLFKDFPIKERFGLQFRFEAFNVTNTPSFANPNSDLSQAGTFGKITSTYSGARELQFALKLKF